MNHLEVLRQAWQTTWNYRALWVFGVILALVTVSWGTAVLLDRDDATWPESWWMDPESQRWEEYGITITPQPGETVWEALRRTLREKTRDANRALRELFDEELGIGLRPNVWTIIVGLSVVAVLTYVVTKTLRYVSETVLIRMVGEHQQTGKRMRVGQGLRLGWSRSAWRLFLIDLAIDVIAVLAGLLLFGLIFAPLPLWVNGSEGIIFLFAILTGGLFFVALFVVIVEAAAASVAKRLARQACALEGLRAGQAIRAGCSTLLRHRKDTGFAWLITLGVRLGWSVLVAPLVLLLLGTGLVLGGLPAVAAGGLAGLATTGDVPVFVALALGIPILLLVLVAPPLLLAGLREVFISSLWTLTYRELRDVESVASEQMPTVDPAGLEAAAAA